jgi:transcription initiation factor TFIID subunit 6
VPAITAGGEDGTQAPDVNVSGAAQQTTTANAAPTVQQQQQAAKRAAALASLQYDAGLQNLLPYIVRWVGQSVVTAIRNSDGVSDGSESERRQRELAIAGETLEVMLKVIHALIQNERLFIEPYVSRETSSKCDKS